MNLSRNFSLKVTFAILYIGVCVWCNLALVQIQKTGVDVPDSQHYFSFRVFDSAPKFFDSYDRIRILGLESVFLALYVFAFLYWTLSVIRAKYRKWENRWDKWK